MPDALSRFEIDRHQTLAKQSVAVAMAAEVVAGWRLDRQVGDAELFVDRDLGPHARVAGVGPRVVEPGVVAELAGPWNGVEGPQALARARVESANIAFDVGLGPTGRTV